MSSRLRSLRVYCVPYTAIGSHLQSFFNFLFAGAGVHVSVGICGDQKWKSDTLKLEAQVVVICSI